MIYDFVKLDARLHHHYDGADRLLRLLHPRDYRPLMLDNLPLYGVRTIYYLTL